ncbi:MAG: hypothetical protein IKZ07_05660 [Akkermansia sp.]|nr:hypothetical protein [Akkermansia sp.]
MLFDEEGREELQLCLRLAIKERDHDFLLPDIDEARNDDEWVPRDFMNIECHPNDDEPLFVEDGIVITGGTHALTALAKHLQASSGCVTIG